MIGESMSKDLPLPRPALDLPAGSASAVSCRACGVCCDLVVDPSSCLEQACEHLVGYADAAGRSFVGCARGVFRSDIAVEALEAARPRGFGGLRCARRPLAVCRTSVARAYRHRAGEIGCVNPEFFEPPREDVDAIRVTATRIDRRSIL
jgi:hypothetical protein